MTLTLSTKMVRLAEDRAMFKIARFEKQFRYLRGYSEILRIAYGRQELTILNSEAQLTGQSEHLIVQMDSLHV